MADAEVGELVPIQYWMARQEFNDPGVMHVAYVLQGDRGAVSWVYYDWHPNTPLEQRVIDTTFVIKFGHTLYPMSAGLDYHSPVPHAPYQADVSHECDWTSTGQCYGDGTATGGSQLMDEWIASERDDQVIWNRLRDYYVSRFHDTGPRDIGDLDFGESLMGLAQLLAADEEDD